MRNKELVNRKLEQMDGQLQAIKVIITRPGVTSEDVNEKVEKCQSLISEIKSMVEREPMSGQDANPYMIH